VWLAFLFSLLHLAGSYAAGGLDPYAVLNSDVMFVPLFWEDFRRSFSLAGWVMPTNPYFFPDVALYALIRVFTPDVDLALGLFGLLQLLILTIGLLLVLRELPIAQHRGQPVALLVVAVMYLLIASGRQILYLNAFMAAHHFGIVAVAFYYLSAVLAAFSAETRGGRRRSVIGLGVLTALLAVSDSLFIVQFVAPVVAVSALLVGLRRLPWRRALIVNGMLLLAALAGQIARLAIVPVGRILSYTQAMSLQGIGQSLYFLAEWAGTTAVQEPLLAGLWLTSILALAAVTMRAARSATDRRSVIPAAAILIVTGTIFGSAAASLAAAVATGNFVVPQNTRYIQPALFLPLLTGWPLWIAQGERSARPPAATAETAWRAGLATAAIVVIGFVVFAGRLPALPRLAANENPFVACLTREAEQRGLMHGMTHYWRAASTSALSKGRLNVVAVRPDLTAYIWVAQRNWYRRPFEFVVVEPHAAPEARIDEATVIQKFGLPAETFACGRSNVFVYNRPTDIRIQNWFTGGPYFTELARPGAAARFYGYTLPSPAGGTTVGFSQAADERWSTQAGILAVARIQDVTPGDYAVAIDTYADGVNTGAWAVVALARTTADYLAGGPLANAGKTVSTATVHLNKRRTLEIQVEYAGHGALYVDEIRIERLAAAGAQTAVAYPPLAAAQGAPALTLLYPEQASAIAIGPMDFAWEWTGPPLSPDQAFEVRLWQRDDEYHFGALDAVVGRELIRQIGDTYSVRMNLNGAYSVMQHGAGDYSWTVGIVGLAPAYHDLQIEAPPRSLRLSP
jgi:hypothetical protein